MLFNKPIAEVTDQELIQLYRTSGEMEVLGYLYTRYTSLVYGVCLKYGKTAMRRRCNECFEKLIQLLQEHEVKHFKAGCT